MFGQDSWIRHLRMSHNAPYLPPKILHNLSGCFSFLLDITAVPREIENNAYVKFWGARRRIMGDVQVAYIGVVLFFIGPDFVSVNTMLDLLQVDLS